LTVITHFCDQLTVHKHITPLAKHCYLRYSINLQRALWNIH